MLLELVPCRRIQNLFHSVQLNVNNPHFLDHARPHHQGEAFCAMAPNFWFCIVQRLARSIYNLATQPFGKPQTMLVVASAAVVLRKHRQKSPEDAFRDLTLLMWILEQGFHPGLPVEMSLHKLIQIMLIQVLNMKPPEILSMLEEAAGTRMYENKKEAALKTLEKKQIKVEEINKVGLSEGQCHMLLVLKQVCVEAKANRCPQPTLPTFLDKKLCA